MCATEGFKTIKMEEYSKKKKNENWGSQQKLKSFVRNVRLVVSSCLFPGMENIKILFFMIFYHHVRISNKQHLFWANNQKTRRVDDSSFRGCWCEIATGNLLDKYQIF